MLEFSHEAVKKVRRKRMTDLRSFSVFCLSHTETLFVTKGKLAVIRYSSNMCSKGKMQGHTV